MPLPGAPPFVPAGVPPPDAPPPLPPFPAGERLLLWVLAPPPPPIATKPLNVELDPLVPLGLFVPFGVPAPPAPTTIV